MNIRILDLKSRKCTTSESKKYYKMYKTIYKIRYKIKYI